MKKLKNYVNKKLLNKSNINSQLDLLENLSLFLNQGYSLNETITLLNSKYNLDKIINYIEEGYLLSQIFMMEKYDNDILLIIEISEKSGCLKDGINNALTILKQKEKSKNMIIELLKYPMFLFFIILFALSFVGFFLIPQFESIYQSFNMELNFLMKSFFIIIKILPLFLILLMIIIISLWLYFIKQDEIRKKEIIFKNKYAKKIYIDIYNQVFVINLVNLMKIGLRLDEIFMILQEQKYNLFLKQESKIILDGLKDGNSLYSVLNKEYYLNELIILIKEGEVYSSLLHNLENYTLFLDKSKKNRTKKILFLIQPIFYGLFGILIIMLYATIFGPMFQMMEGL